MNLVVVEDTAIRILVWPTYIAASSRSTAKQQISYMRVSSRWHQDGVQLMVLFTIPNFDKFVAEESAFSYDVVVEYSRGDQMTSQPTKIRS